MNETNRGGDLLSRPGNVFVNCYSGLGDAIIQAPALQTLADRASGCVYFPKNPALDLFKRLRVEHLESIRSIDVSLRRLTDYSPEDVFTRITDLGIGVIFNLRRDRVQYGERYTSLARALNDRGIHLSDVCDGVSPQEQITTPVYELTRRYFARLSIPVAPGIPGWLRRDAHDIEWPEMTDRPGFYLGAGHQHKRLRDGFWGTLIEHCWAETRLRPLLLSGFGNTEREEARQLSVRLALAGVPHDEAVGLSLDELCKVVAGLPLVVSGDTFVVHLACALGTPVVGLYTATEPMVFGPRGSRDVAVLSSYYHSCPMRNALGNCDGWDLGCSETPCRDRVDERAALEAIMAALPRPPSSVPQSSD